MKMYLSLIVLVFTLVSLNLQAASSTPPAPLPEFMNQQQLATWSAEKASTAQAIASTQEAPSQFYTGKPYVADAGGYIYKYRTFNPEMDRWTLADPSGFPDGANNRSYVLNPINHCDPLGLYSGIIASSQSASKSSTASGTVGWLWNTLQNNTTMLTGIPTSGQGPSTGTVDGYGTGTVVEIDGTVMTTSTNEVFTATINDTTGNITVVATSGSDKDTNSNLQSGLTWTITGSGTQSVTINVSTSSIWDGSGINGVGGAGASVSWTNGQGQTETNTSITLTAE